MTKPLAKIDDVTWTRVEQTVAFFFQNGPRLLQLLQGLDRASPLDFAIRGVLMQDVFGNGTGLMQTIVRSRVPNGFLMTIVGLNPPVEATVHLVLRGDADVIFDAEVVLSDVPSNAQLVSLMSAASVGGPFPLGTEEITVEIGQPFSSPLLVGNPPPPDDPIETNPGRYMITFTEDLLDTYDELTLTVEDPEIVGYSAVVISKYNEVVSEHTEIVTDIFNRPVDHPWRAGSIIGVVPMIDVGYAIMASDYRDVTYTPPTNDAP